MEFGFPKIDPADPADPAETAGLPAPSATGHSDATVIGEIRANVDEVRRGAYRLTIRVANLTSIGSACIRNEVLVRSLVSAHVVIKVTGGELVSLLDPPEPMRDLATSCANVGVWPVLVGDEGSHDCMLASPIILYDYPQIAAESPGDSSMRTEIDEILALRVFDDDGRREARGHGESDERASPDLWNRDRRLSTPGALEARLHGTRCRGTSKGTHRDRADERVGVAAARRAGPGRYALSCLTGGTLDGRVGRVRLLPAGARQRCDGHPPDRSKTGGRGNPSSRTTRERFIWRWCSMTIRGATSGFLRQPGHRFFYAS